jgi:hypothetical protein
MTDSDMAAYNLILRDVIKFFEDDWDKASLWLRSSNPGLGHISPNDLVRLGRIHKLAQFVRNAMAANEAAEAERGQT